MHSITMQFSIVFLALLALVAAIPTTPKYHAADQDFLKKQQDVIYLLENIAGTSAYTPYYEMGVQYEFDKHYDMYENPAVVKYYYGLYRAGQTQPKGTPFSYSVSQLRKEVELLTQIFLGAKDYQTFLYSAAWARVYVNQDQFVTAYSNAVIQRHDMYGVALPAPYEVYPHYFFNSNIIQMVQDYVNKYGYDYQQGKGENYGVYNIYVNYTSYLPYGENKIAYFTEDIGLSAYYSYVQLASYMMPYGPYADKYQQAQEKPYAYGHGAHYYYIHQQFLARYNLERLSQGLEPIRELDYYYEHFTTPYNPHFRYLNGNNFPGRDEHVYVTPRHHHYELVKLVRSLESRILDAIHSGHVITPEGKFLSLYQPQGLDILGNLIEGTGRSVNPRYYGAFQYVAKQLLGNAPEFNNIYEYYPSALELGMTAVRDPMFYQLYSKIIELFHYYQEALPAYQYNDVVVPGVYIEKVEFSDLVTYFSDYQVSLDNAVAQPVGSHKEHQPFPHVNAHLKRLDHKQYEYSIYVKSQKPVPHAVVRVYVGPKYNYNGEPVDINEYRHWFYEIDQFVYDLAEGQNVIVRNSHQATGQSYDYPSIHQLKERVQGALKSQNPYYINYPEQLYGFPARLALPKGSKSGFPLQFFFIITNGGHHQQSYYGPVVEQQWQTYQPHHYQVVEHQEYEQFTRNPVDKVYNGYQTVEVVPDFEGHPIVQGHYHYGYLYNKYPVSYYYPNWQHSYYYGYYPQEYYHGKEYYGKGPYAYYSEKDHQTYFKQGSYESYGPTYYYQHKYEGKYPAGYEGKYPAGYEGKYPAGYEGKYPAGYEGKYPAGYEGKYPAGYEGKYPAGYEGKYPAGYEGKYPAGYEGKYPAGYEGKYPAGYEGKYPAGYEGKYPAGYEGKYPAGYEGKYPAGYEGKYPAGYEGKYPEGKYDHKYYQSHQYPAGYYYGSGHYPGQEGYHGTYPAGTYSGYKSHDEYLHQYYKNQYIGDVIGGGVSLDGYPYGYPFDRPLAYSAFYAHNIYVKDAYVYHHDDYYYQY